MSDSASDTPAGAAPTGTPPLDESLRQVGQSGRAGLGAARHTGRALRHLLLADLALARTAAARTMAWLAVAAVFGASTWLLLMGVLITLLQRMGLSWLAAMSIAAAVSLAVTALGSWQAAKYFQFTRLEATRRQLKKLGIGEEDEDPSDGPGPSPGLSTAEHGA